MKRKICVRSMGLGVVIMILTGLGIGAIIPPPVTQRQFGKISCTGLSVLDATGRRAIDLSTTNNQGLITIRDRMRDNMVTIGIDKNSHLIVSLSTEKGEQVALGITKEGPQILVSDGIGNGSVILNVDQRGGNVIATATLGEGSAALSTHNGIGRVASTDAFGKLVDVFPRK